MCLSGECAACQERERIAHAAYLKDLRASVGSKVDKKPKWIKFKSDVDVGNAANQADPIDTSFLTLTIYPKQRKQD